MIVKTNFFGYQTYNLDNLWTGLSQMGWENEV